MTSTSALKFRFSKSRFLQRRARVKHVHGDLVLQENRLGEEPDRSDKVEILVDDVERSFDLRIVQES